MFSIVTTRRFALWWRLAKQWFSEKFEAIATPSIDFTPVNNKIDTVGGKVDTVGGKVDTVGGKVDTVGGKVDAAASAVIDAMPSTSGLATEDKATQNKQDIITAVNNAQPDLSSVAKQGTNPAATNTAILAAFGNIDFSTLAKQGSNANATLTAILEALTGGDEPSPDIPEGVAERLAMILEYFGIKPISGYEFMQDTEVCDELEVIMQLVDPTLTAAQAAAITAQTLNPSES